MGKDLKEELLQNMPFSSEQEETFLNLMRAYYLMSQHFEALFKPYHLTMVTYNILRILRGANGVGYPCVEISKRMLSRVPDVTRVIDRLIHLDYVRRERSLEDRRIVYQFITTKGLEVLSILDEKVNRQHQKHFASLSKERLSALNSLLDELRQKN